MKTVIKIIIVIVLFYLYLWYRPSLDLAKISINVTDEQGAPVKDVTVMSGCWNGRYKNVGKTDKNGRYSVTSRSCGEIDIGAARDGYYSGGVTHIFRWRHFGIWLPWNEQIKIVLRPIVNPVPMYARNLDWFEVPVTGKAIGYDLMVSDWVKPHGNGRVADFLIKVDKRFTSNTDYAGKLEIRFSNPSDGILSIKEKIDPYKLSSSYRLPRTAPEKGYAAKLERQRFYDRGTHDNYSKDNNYIFRVRSVTDGRGNLVQAMYGKIVGDIQFDPQDSKAAIIKLQYYLNPDHTRNLEFDPKRNLLTNLPVTEQVVTP